MDRFAMIAACEGVYRATDVARHFGTTSQKIRLIWESGFEFDEIEPPNIWGCDPLPGLLDRDVFILHEHGITVPEIAEELCRSTAWVRQIAGRWPECVTEGCERRSITRSRGLCHACTGKERRARSRG